MTAQEVADRIQAEVGDEYAVTVRESNGSYFGEISHADGSASFSITPPGTPLEPRAHVIVSVAGGGVPLGARIVEALIRRIGREVYAVTEESLDDLPDRSLVQVVSLTSLGSQTFESYDYFEKHGGRWLHLDPGDRDDGERTEPSLYLVNRANNFGSSSERRPAGRIRIMFVPAA